MKSWLYQLCVLVYMLSHGSVYLPYRFVRLLRFRGAGA
jgi:hypothetical protein